MLKFIYSEFNRNISAFPWRSISFILSFSCTYFILIFTSFGIKNLFLAFEDSTKNYEILVILNPSTDEALRNSLKFDIKELDKSIVTTDLTSGEVYDFLNKDDPASSIVLTDEDISAFVPQVIRVNFSNLSSINKIVLATKIKTKFKRLNYITDITTPYPQLHRLAEIYISNKYGMLIFMVTLYFSVFVLLYLLLTLSLKEHSKKINLFRVLGFKRNFIRWPLILEGTFLSLAGFIFSMVAMYSVFLQMKTEYSNLLNLRFFSFFEFTAHLILCVSIVFFLATLLTQRIISDDFVEN